MIESMARESAPPMEGRSGTVGRVGISLRAADGETVVGDLFQQAPLRAFFPNSDREYGMAAVIANTSGGVVGGDRLRLDLGLEEGARALVTGQAAEKIYRSSGPESQLDVTLTVRDESDLQYLPQGTIVFDGARFRRNTVINASPGARVLAGEVLTLGRFERGERFTAGQLHDAWWVRVDERLVWADALHLSEDSGSGLGQVIDSPTGFDGCSGFATFLYVAGDAPDHVQAARELQATYARGMRAGVTSFPGILVARWLGPDPAMVREAFGVFWQRFASLVWGRDIKLPTIWQI